jgi:hypothetical protein
VNIWSGFVRLLERWSEDTRLASLSVLARELIKRGIVDEGALALELEQIGWTFADGQLESAPVSAPRPDAATQAVPDVRTAVVLTALPLEAEAVIEHLDDAREEEHQRGTVTESYRTVRSPYASYRSSIEIPSLSSWPQSGSGMAYHGIRCVDRREIALGRGRN